MSKMQNISVVKVIKGSIFFGNGKISPVSNEMTNSLNHFVVCLY